MQDLHQDVVEAGRQPGSVVLLPVSKTFGVETLNEAYDCGMRKFGENYVQEGCEKIDWFRKNRPEAEIEWHMIGPLQSNKTRPVAERFDWVQTIDRIKIAQRLSEQRPPELPPLNVLIEVNISNEDSKSGVQPADVFVLAQAINILPNLKFRGLMCVPEVSDSPKTKLVPLQAMKILFDELRDRGYDIDTLSMGMSGDMKEAVRAGSTMVRIGTAIFGPRQYPNRI